MDSSASSSSSAPKAIRILRERQVVEIDWSDGHASSFAAVALRWLCPCAYCRGEAGLPGWLDSTPQLTSEQTRLVGGEMIGGYAICLFWGDGHRTGYYTFDLLRRHCTCTHCIGAARREEKR